MSKSKVDTRKVLLFLPLLLLPFLALAFYALGGGQGKPEADTQAPKGINTELPGAQFKQAEPSDKLAAYNQADRDSVKTTNAVADVANRLGFQPAEDLQTKAINEKLAVIRQQVGAPVSRPTVTGNNLSTVPVEATPGLSKDVARLEALMKNMQRNGADGDDPEMKQLSGMMDKILAIQNPELARKQTAASTKPDTLFKAIPAVVSRDQKIIEGAVVELRLLDTVMLNGQQVPKGQLIYGLASISNQRLNLEIKNIGLGSAIIPVNFTVFDKRDAMPGINAPEAELGSAASNGGVNALQSMQFLSMDQSLGVQAAGAGIEAAKGLLSKKVKRIKVKLKAGYAVLLRNNDNNRR